MNFETYTERARSVLQSAQTAALAAGHQIFLPEHILKALLEDRDQLAVNLIRAAGGKPELVQQKTEEAIRAQPSVSGGDTGLRLDQKTAKLFADAEAGAKKAGDSFVTVERILVALAGLTGSKAADALKTGGVTPQSLETAVAQLRQGRTADSENAEDQRRDGCEHTDVLLIEQHQDLLGPLVGGQQPLRLAVEAERGERRLLAHVRLGQVPREQLEHVAAQRLRGLQLALAAQAQLRSVLESAELELSDPTTALTWLADLRRRPLHTDARVVRDDGAGAQVARRVREVGAERVAGGAAHRRAREERARAGGGDAAVEARARAVRRPARQDPARRGGALVRARVLRGGRGRRGRAGWGGGGRRRPYA